LFSVIIPAYNYGDYLPRNLDSVLAQTSNNFEIVVVDDGSTDNTADVVRGYQKKSKQRIVYEFQSNRGPAAARNQGIKHSSGEYLFFLDADDVMMPDVLEHIQCVLTANGNPDFVIGGRIWVDSQGRERHRFVRGLSHASEQNFARYVRGRLGRISPGSFVVHRNVFSRIRYPEEIRVSEDWVFIAQLLALYKGATFRTPIVKLFRHDNSQSGDGEWTRRDRLKSVDLLFDPAVLPPGLMSMRTEVLSLVYLAMFLFFYRRNEFSDARPLYHRAIRSYPQHLLKLKYLRKYMWTCLAGMRAVL
jgi:glycosyltransferase involved in cell wall biosynthesis